MINPGDYHDKGDILMRKSIKEQIEKRKAELAESDELYHAIVVASPISIMTIRNGCFVFVNPAGARMLGYSNSDEMVGKPITDIIAPESQQLVSERIRRIGNGKDNPRADIALIRQDGIRIIVESTYVSVLIGRIPTAVIIAQDITERRQLEVELQESQGRFQAFMDNTPGAVYIKDENDVHVYCNQFAAGVVNMKPEDFIGSRTHDLFPSKIADRLVELDQKVLNENIARVAEEHAVTVKEKICWFKDIKFPIKLASGKKLLGGISFDITESKRRELELQKAYSQIKRLHERLEAENVYLREEIELRHKHEEIIGNSKAVRRMLKQVELVAETDSTVLILGETGTGKGLLAKAIHRMSSRHHRAMITVNCGTLPASLIESELFGREKGAFTGALTGRTGRFEIADGSTLFLDEIGELSPDVQVKLLRVLEEGRFERLGSNKTIKVDVRIIAATNRDLEKAVHEGSFRQDLFYRLNVFPITVPPLRDRIEDIELLVWAFVVEYGEQMGKRIESIRRKDMDALREFPWRGNVRELRNVIEQSMIITNSTTLKVELPESPEQEKNQAVLLKDVERNHILKILQHTGWRVRGKAGAAELLGLKPTTLDSRMKKLDILRPK